jgi:hypothetical protein
MEKKGFHNELQMTLKMKCLTLANRRTSEQSEFAIGILSKIDAFRASRVDVPTGSYTPEMLEEEQNAELAL